MPDLNNRIPKNVPGPFYVDESCIDCDMCRAAAPAFFARDDESGYTYVHRQPLTAEEFALAEQSLSECPSESIGHDGLAATVQLPT